MLVLPGSSSSPGSPPSSAVIAAERLAKPGAVARAALAPALADVLPSGAPVPSGSRLTLGLNSWRQEAGFAHVAGTLHLADGHLAQVTVGYVRVKAHWLITYVEPRG